MMICCIKKTKKFIAFFIIGYSLVFSNHAYGQLTEWVRKTSSSLQTLQQGYRHPNLKELATDLAGNIYFAGNFEGIIKLNGINYSAIGVGLFIGKYDAKGNLLWFKTIPNNGVDITGLTTDRSGNVIVAGLFKNSLTIDNFTITDNACASPFILKLHPSGQTIWINALENSSPIAPTNCNPNPNYNLYDFSISNDVANFKEVKCDKDDNIVLVGHFNSADKYKGDSLETNPAYKNFSLGVLKVDKNGNKRWAKFLGNNSSYNTSTRLLALCIDDSSNITVAGCRAAYLTNGCLSVIPGYNYGTGNPFTQKYDALGNCLLGDAYYDSPFSSGLSAKAFSDIEVGKSGNLYSIFRQGNYNAFYQGSINKITTNQNYKWQKYYGSYIQDKMQVQLSKYEDVYSFLPLTNVSAGAHSIFLKLDSVGIEDWTMDLPIDIKAIAADTFGAIYIGGLLRKEVSSSVYAYDFILVKIRDITLGNRNLVSGRLYSDVNRNCLLENTESRFSNKKIVAYPDSLIAFTKSDGAYRLRLAAGVHHIVVEDFFDNQMLIDSICPSSKSIAFQNESGDSINGLNFGVVLKPCSFLTVDVTNSRQRRCRTNTIVINYSNQGGDTAFNSKIELKLPSYSEVKGASKPFTFDSNYTYTFSLGNIPPASTGQIVVYDSVLCIPQLATQSVCAEATIFPINECAAKLKPKAASWDSSSLSISGYCTQDSIHYTIKNGGANMSSFTKVFVYLDSAIVFRDSLKLNASDSVVGVIPNLARYIRIVVYQNPNNPFDSVFQFSNYLCLIPFNITLANVQNYAQDDDEVNKDIACIQIVDSYDPNDKKVLPNGISVDNIVPLKSTLKYTINFQNTGSDTAYEVRLLDTLDSKLDLSTLRFTGSSFPFDAQVLHHNGIYELYVLFKKINLLPLMENEEKSMGFIKFEIKPKSNLPQGTVIKNSCNIYFDYNEPITTNIAWVTLLDSVFKGSFTTSTNEIAVGKEVLVYPNPSNGLFNIVLNGFENKKHEVFISDVSGREILKYDIDIKQNSEKFPLELKGFSPGTYLIQVRNARESYFSKISLF